LSAEGLRTLILGAHQLQTIPPTSVYDRVAQKSLKNKKDWDGKNFALNLILKILPPKFGY